jgi:1-acyl-sn-glycerol-3-phosphate acyltransferase
MKPQYRCGWLLSRLAARLVFRVRVSGLEHLPKTGGFILASNHISYYDPPLLGSWVPRELFFFAKKELFRNRVIGAVLRSVNALPVKRGVIDRQALGLAIEAIRRGYGLVMFPEGTRSRTGQFLEAKPGIGMIAGAAGCAIVPAYLRGFDRPRDCLLWKTRAVIALGTPLAASWVTSFPADKNGYLAISRGVMERIAELRRTADNP